MHRKNIHQKTNTNATFFNNKNNNEKEETNPHNTFCATNHNNTKESNKKIPQYEYHNDFTLDKSSKHQDYSNQNTDLIPNEEINQYYENYLKENQSKDYSIHNFEEVEESEVYENYPSN